jgi:MFS family permease
MTTGSLVLGLVTRDLMGLYLFAFIFGVAWGNQAVLRFSLASEVFGLGSLGTIVGVLNFFESAAATVGSYLAGWIFDTSGSYGPVFWIGIGVSVAGAVLAWVVKPLHRAVP